MNEGTERIPKPRDKTCEPNARALRGALLDALLVALCAANEIIQRKSERARILSKFDCHET